MVYKIVEIKYTVLHVMQSCTKKANVMYTGQGNKEQVSQDLKDRFLIFLLITCLLKLTLRKLTQIHSKTPKKQNCTGRGGGNNTETELTTSGTMPTTK
jgi:hypothetical protein